MAEASWRDVQLEDPLGIEVGYRLIPMVDALQNGELLGRIRSIRKKFAQEMGFLPLVVHIRDNLEMQPAAYRILLKGVQIGRGEAFPGRWMAINPGNAQGALSGDVTRDPAFGLPAVWIDSALKERAQIQGYTVVEASSVVATHLNHLIGKYASELLGRQETQQLLERVTQEMPKLTEDFIPVTLPLTQFQKVLHNLLAESIPIRDMRTIIEVLTEHAPVKKDAADLPQVVRAVDGAWQGSGTQLILAQRVGAVASPALRPRRPPPADAVVTSVSWHVESERPLPAGVRLAICLGGRCFFPDRLAGRSLALTGQPAGNPATLWLKWPGRGAIVPPVRLLRYRLLINYQSAGKGFVTR